MKIGILGATGKAGSAITHEALDRSHAVTALVRDEDKAREEFGESETLEIHVVDAVTMTSDDIVGLDVVISAFGVPPEQAEQHLTVTENLIELVRELGPNAPRLIFILGAGSLNHEGGLFIEQLRQIPGSEDFIAVPENQLRQLEYLRGIDDVDWTGVSPQADFSPGAATDPKLGREEILLAGDGESHTTAGTMAVAIVDEIERPAHRGTRFTVSDA